MAKVFFPRVCSGTLEPMAFTFAVQQIGLNGSGPRKFVSADGSPLPLGLETMAPQWLNP
jgi:hypothetical protein